MSRQTKQFYEFGNFRVDVSERLLWRDEEKVPLTSKVFDLLMAFLENSHRTVEKGELCRRVWPESKVVDDANLSRNIFILRKAISDGDNGRRLIETVPRRGYRFLAEVRELYEERNRTSLEEESGLSPVVKVEEFTETVDSPDQQSTEALSQIPHSLFSVKRIAIAAASLLVVLLAALLYFLIAGRARPTSLSQVRSIAVIPFKSLNAYPADDYLGLALADALITRMGSIRQVVVRPTSSVRRFASEDGDTAAIGRALKVDGVLEGSIQKSDDRIRITVQLISSADGSHLWADKFDVISANALSLEDHVAEELTGALTLKLSGDEAKRLAEHQTENVEAYKLYLKGRYYWNRRDGEGFKKGIECFQQAIDLDPGYALVYAGLADCYNQLGNYQIEKPEDAFPKARAAVAKALELDEDLAEAHTSLAFGLLYYDWNYPAAEAEFKRAIEINPNYSTAHHWYSIYLSLAGRFDESLAQLRRANELDPLSLIINMREGSLYYHARRYDEAIARLEKALEMNSNFAPALSYLCMAYTEKGMYEQAIEGYRKMSEGPGGEYMLSGLAHVYARAGRRKEARKTIARLKELSQSVRISPIYWAIAYVAIGDDDETMKWMERAYEERESWMLYLNIDPRFDPLRSDPRFRSLIERVGLPQNR